MYFRDPIVRLDHEGRHALFALADDGAVAVRSQIDDAGTWCEWERLGANNRGFAVARDASGMLHLFVRGPDDAVSHVVQTPPAWLWGGFAPMGGKVKALSAASNADARMELFAIGMDDALWHTWQTAADGPWSGWASLGGKISALEAAIDARGCLLVFGIGADGALWWTRQVAPGGRWLPWASLGGKIKSFVAGDAKDARMEVFAIGMDDAVWQLRQAPPGADGSEGAWGAWTSLGGKVKQVVVASGIDGRLDVFGIGMDHAAWCLPQSAANGAFEPWRSLGGQFQKLSVWSDPQGRMTLFAIGRDEALWCLARGAAEGARWSPWGRFPESMHAPASLRVSVMLAAPARAGKLPTTNPAPAEPAAEPTAEAHAAARAETVPDRGQAAVPRVHEALEAIREGALFARDFRVVKPLARGGMGAVYVVEQVSTGRPRALKVMLPEVLADARLRERFAEEARITSKIESDHVVESVAAGVDEATGTPWLAMELLQGETLADALEKRAGFALEHARALFDQFGHALVAAHAAGVVHRDLKPENLYLAVPRRKGVPFTLKVLDFGIAKVLNESRAAARATVAMGSPFWMAPEQSAAGAAIVPATDVWALGLIAFYVLTGKEYWRAARDENATLASVLLEMLVEELPKASARAAELGVAAALPPGFDDWFAQCVNRDPEARFQSAAPAMAALESVLRDGSPPAR